MKLSEFYPNRANKILTCPIEILDAIKSGEISSQLMVNFSNLSLASLINISQIFLSHTEKINLSIFIQRSPSSSGPSLIECIHKLDSNNHSQIIQQLVGYIIYLSLQIDEVHVPIFIYKFCPNWRDWLHANFYPGIVTYCVEKKCSSLDLWEIWIPSMIIKKEDIKGTMIAFRSIIARGGENIISKSLAEKIFSALPPDSNEKREIQIFIEKKPYLSTIQS
jgi:hypothetical protein